MLNKLRRRIVAPFAALLAFGAAGPAAAREPQAARPALWAVADADTTIYLFGTIHLLPDNVQWRTAQFDHAVAGSQQLILETILDEKNPTKLMSALTGMAYSKGLPPIADRVPPAKRAALEAALAKTGIPRTYFDQMETWAAAFMLLGNQFREMGLKGGQGVETILRDSFTSAGKPVGELETNIQQLGFFDTLPEDAQRALLEGSIEQPAAMSKEFDQMLAAWSRGDVEAIAETFDKELEASPPLKDAVLRRRNANWSKWIEQRMGQPGAVMIAVGAGHLAGKESVIAMLQKDGYSVRRLQ
jgi:uncharacterized protein YbaP (TraB family)